MVTCPQCQSPSTIKYGHTHSGKQRYCCHPLMSKITRKFQGASHSQIVISQGQIVVCLAKTEFVNIRTKIYDFSKIWIAEKPTA